MSKHSKISSWAQTQGYTFRAETEGFATAGVRELDSFRGWEGASNHVTGEYRGRPFEMLEFTINRARRHGSSHVDQTALLLPNAASTLPDFEIIPRDGLRLSLDFFGASGLKLAKDDAHRMTREMVEAFSKHYMIFAGGIMAMAADSMGKADAPELDLDAVAKICKPNMLRFLTKHPGWFIESQGGHLVLWKPNTVLAEHERTELLRMASELLDQLSRAEHERSVPGMAVENTMDLNRGKLVRILGGGVVGFFLGSFTGMILAFAIDPKFVLSIPVFAMLGLAAGAFIGKKLSK